MLQVWVGFYWREGEFFIWRHLEKNIIFVKFYTLPDTGTQNAGFEF